MTGHGPMCSTSVDPRVARSRARIVTAATELLVESGPRGVTVDAIAERSGVAKTTIYRHWPSINDLLIDVIHANVPDLTPTVLETDCEAALRSVMHQVAHRFADPDWVRIVPSLVALGHEFPEVADLMRSDRFERMGPIAELIDQGVAEGALPPGLDATRATQLLIGPLFFAMIMGDVDDLAALADVVVDRLFAARRGADAGPVSRPNPRR